MFIKKNNFLVKFNQIFFALFLTFYKHFISRLENFRQDSLKCICNAFYKYISQYSCDNQGYSQERRCSKYDKF